ncbi:MULTISPECIES: hypothetical protein [unclassified Methylobacterium]|uniref:hypothetical protein n=1 Tax=unclassified Methylobacterium TaxID=2615210 RepID=UPI0006FA0C15|nr:MULTISPECIES: hypothetical protein [unclassified Methylobacterium]KQP91907.1 hypothetical protein ASF57_05315 [Methylobacterium sp. Leaf117]MCK2055852.1 hypothetical protein [Methylobacterium sp. 37f]
MNLLVRPFLAAALALGSTAPFAQTYTPPAGLAAAGAPGGQTARTPATQDRGEGAPRRHHGLLRTHP